MGPTAPQRTPSTGTAAGAAPALPRPASSSRPSLLAADVLRHRSGLHHAMPSPSSAPRPSAEHAALHWPRPGRRALARQKRRHLDRRAATKWIRDSTSSYFQGSVLASLLGTTAA
ncbi:hypothetical protein BDA96_09G019500 [Sorghum bicolor]|uniref:Uncharacterized protein n=1 Tax=Sorghum bicolor TaxID=4558 RepID=A0A921U2Q3_SORBI|nr:uncharacterized protein LOC110430274 isoform X2 [Sorghum bicolor]KAG0516627.1 hypothetical protein BDA96_09G019500 [Sorghum bicolor]|eukprot:XP_021303330.1 uncharacterized protein LOC110430274 isoform X2 [Sorghum bicolor]